MSEEITLRLDTDYVRFDCAKCGRGHEVDVTYRGYGESTVPQFEFKCSHCGMSSTRKGDAFKWHNLPRNSE